MWHVFASNQTEQLVDQLVAQLAAHRKVSGLGAFERLTLIAPNPQMEAYLRLEIARRQGVAANLAIATLDEHLSALLAQAKPAPLRLLDGPSLRALALELLLDPELPRDDPALAPALRFLGDEDPDAPELRERRASQLAGQIASLFEHYIASRPAMLDGWLVGELFFEQTVAAPVEGWQRALWRLMCDPHDGLITRLPGARYVSLGQLPELIQQGRLPLPRLAHIFGMTHLRPADYPVLEAISTQSILFGYDLNPSEEYWEDLRFGRAESASAQEPSLLSSASIEDGGVDYRGDDDFWHGELDAPVVLRMWGFAGALHQRVLTQLQPNVEIDPRYAPHEQPGCTLHHLQQDLLRMQRPHSPPPLADEDDSVRVLASPSLKREVESIASAIWAMLDENARARASDPSVALLRPGDIAVLVNDRLKEQYQTHIRAVFPATRKLPFNMIDMPATRWSRALEAVELLLSLPFGQFRRQELLRLLTHPTVLASAPQVDPQDWVRWCDALKILHGADRRDHADTYIEDELFHWDQGLRRLVLGAFMTGQRSRDRRVFSVGRRDYLPHEVGPQRLASAGKLVLLARALIEDARFCREARMPLASWADLLCRLLTAYLSAAEPDDEYDLQAARAALASLRDQDLCGRPVGYRVAFELARDALQALEVRHGQFLLDGVVVASLLPRRPLPFKVIFIAGLGEGQFPEPEARRPEDLRFVLDREGREVMPRGATLDVDPRDIQRYTILETMLCARERLILSYVDRDPRSGEARAPSPVISELLYALGQDYMPRDADGGAASEEAVLARWSTRHEARRYHPRYFASLFPADPSLEVQAAPQAAPLPESAQPEAGREARALALRADLQAHCEARQLSFPDLDALSQALPEPSWQRLSGGLGLLAMPALGAPGLEAEPPLLRLSTSDLRAFLECPLQGGARALLRLGDENDEGALLEEDELFESPANAGTTLLQDVFWEKLARALEDPQAASFEGVYDARARYFELAGLIPTGPFFSAARQRHLRLLTMWQENLPRLGLGELPKIEVHRFGRVAEHDWVDKPAAPLSFEVDIARGPRAGRLRVELSGRTDAILPEQGASLINHQTQRAYTLSPRYFMRGFLDHVLLSARGILPEHRTWSVVVNPGEEALPFKVKNCVRRFEPMNPDEARTYLRGLVTDLLGGAHAYYMPIEVTFEHIEKQAPLEATAERWRGNRWRTSSADFGPVRDPRRFWLPDDAEQIIARRYGPYFERQIMTRRP